MKLIQKLKTFRLLSKVVRGLPDNEIMKNKLKSRKLWAAVLGGALNAFGGQLGLSPDILLNISQLIMVYIGGQAIADVYKG